MNPTLGLCGWVRDSPERDVADGGKETPQAPSTSCPPQCDRSEERKAARASGRCRTPPAEQDATPIRRPSRDSATSPKLLSSGAVEEVGRSPVRTSLPVLPAFGRLGPVRTALLPGRVFFAMGRPVPGFVCCVLQASLLGWVPAALWAFWAERGAATKQRSLAARLRPL